MVSQGTVKAMRTRKALVLGGGGFIGSHMVKRLKLEGFWVRAVDLKLPPYAKTMADDFIIGDLRSQTVVLHALDLKFDEIYQFAADMGGAGFVFTGESDFDIMHNSSIINLNVIDGCLKSGNNKVFYSSSACVYPEYNQIDPQNPNCEESSAYPADPDSEYGWEKLFSERLYLAASRNKSLQVRIARYHNIFGEEGCWDNGREKVPAAICRKVALARDGGSISIWGDGEQTRSFLYIDECTEASVRLMRSGFEGPVNIGSQEMVTINQLVRMVSEIADKTIKVDHIDGPVGVRGRNSENSLYEREIGWKVSASLAQGLERTFSWINEQVNLAKSA